ncbi:MAG: hypothetical protein IKI35_03990, partial [Stomatobaculum sp.]|nr:hypothetical protein [Stomatobaculum sp.]
WHYLEDGEPVTNDWRYISYNNESCWYFFNNDGVMQTGWQFIDGKWYFFEPAVGSNQGRMYRSEWNSEGYYLGADGVWVISPSKAETEKPEYAQEKAAD